ncbi:hypothetical protein EI168_05275 [Halomonas sp. FME1]|uniref:Uncharacterized protein n=1 Tax=Halomonas casei TaxID=2742613 RepID=A0ABR9EZ72_9GAMM|nr:MULTISPECIES: hypothetical protein [Halomonas]MBE0399522.1 hypothetical protein [Halomonas casei]
MITGIQSSFDVNTKRFLLSLYEGTPDFGAIDCPEAAKLPAVLWKLINLEKLKSENASKYAEQRHELEKLLK